VIGNPIRKHRGWGPAVQGQFASQHNQPLMLSLHTAVLLYTHLTCVSVVRTRARMQRHHRHRGPTA